MLLQYWTSRLPDDALVTLSRVPWSVDRFRLWPRNPELGRKLLGIHMANATGYQKLKR